MSFLFGFILGVYVSVITGFILWFYGNVESISYEDAIKLIKQKKEDSNGQDHNHGRHRTKTHP